MVGGSFFFFLRHLVHKRRNPIALWHEGESAESCGPDVFECCKLEAPRITTHFMYFAQYAGVLEPL